MTFDRRRFLHSAGALALGAASLPTFAFANKGPFALPAGASIEKMVWWREARFGMFVHWGLYSILAGEWGGKTNYGEWIRNNAKIPLDEYDTLRARFNPVEFNADRLAAMAAQAGAKYLVITTKHHDGFCLFDSKQTTFNVMNTPYRRDIMRAVANACRAHGVRPCWYHSIMDWHHPDYLPRRDWEVGERPVGRAQFERYVRYLHAQVEELLTHYGDIGVLWFDGEWESTWTRELGAALADRCRALSPNILLNSRVAPGRPKGADGSPVGVEIGDFGTPEQKIPDRGLPGVDWESCITMNQNWGYNRADHDFKSVRTLIGLLVETASKGGNLLLNVGPTGTGAVPAESVERLRGMGQWMRTHSEAIYGTEASPFDGAAFRATRRGKRLNCFLPEWPLSRELPLPGVWNVPLRARLLGSSDRRSLPVRQTPSGLVVELPAAPANEHCSVLALDFQETVPRRV